LEEKRRRNKISRFQLPITVNVKVGSVVLFVSGSHRKYAEPDCLT